jgi:vacuolar-type H+-ATPase subunit I/STV1
MATQCKSLSELVKEIETQANKGDDHLIATAMLVRELKNRIKAGEAGEGVKWTVWAKENFRLSKSRLYELDIIGSSTNPKATLAYYRQQNRERQKRLRERAVERNPERCCVIGFIKTMDIERVRRVRKFIAILMNA